VGEEKFAYEAYSKIRDSEAEFDRVAKQQATPTLAANAGKTEPFGRHTTGNEDMEKVAFQLRPGEISQVFGTKDGAVVLKCVKHLPPDGVQLSTCRADLERDIINRKITQQEIPKLFAELRQQADPKILMAHQLTEAELVQGSKKLFHEDGAKTTKSPGSN
jgi:parvulin-like peptidyl-prolyl isomerase